ncbi:MAG: GvpL/GvpF family gas vesicle protein [Verrucomicrobia bacterium]|nr:GvpL/GvpF family gas vesicle protein [Verrucomicrobiota bacterium]
MSNYLYAITAAKNPPRLGDLQGVSPMPGKGGRVELLTAGSVAAVVSDVAGSRIRPERRNLAAHQKVLDAIKAGGQPFLPSAFGIMAPSQKSLVAMLEANADTLMGDLNRLADKVEMTLRLKWNVPNIFDYFVGRTPDLAELRDRYFGQPGGPSREDKIELGSQFDQLLNQARERHVATLRRALGGVVEEFAEKPVADETMVCHLVCLITRDAEGAFEDKLVEAARLFDDHFAFDYNGPAAPHHFVQARLEMPGLEEDEPAGTALVEA